MAFPNTRTTVHHTAVVIFRGRSEVHAFLPELAAGAHYSQLPNDVEPAPVVVVGEGLTTATRVKFYHELTHDLFARNFGWAPPWRNEGWAQYYSTLRVEGDCVCLGVIFPTSPSRTIPISS